MTQQKYRYRFLLIGMLLFVTLLPRDVARADVGLPPAQPGSSLSPGDYVTSVQMVSEVVEIVIAEDSFKASVLATFQMRNNGTEDEEIEVWFPLGERQNYAKKDRVIQVADFQAWVDSDEKNITIEKSDDWNLVWVHWPVYFPAETPVTIRVSYRLSPSLETAPSSCGRFDYILETGAGWQGVIEKAEITVLAPYPLDEMDALLGFGGAFFANPSGYSLNHSEVRWVFTNLEPTENDNINFSLFRPKAWRSLSSSYETLQTNPDDWEAHENLAHGLSGWGSAQDNAEYHGFTKTSIDMDSIKEMVRDSWLKVLEISPPEVNRYRSALSHFRMNPQVIEPYQLQNIFNEAIELFPEDEHLIDLYNIAIENGLIIEGAASVSPTPPASTATAAPTNPTETSAPEELSTSINAPSFSLMMGILFIGAAGVLIFIAVKRGVK